MSKKLEKFCLLLERFLTNKYSCKVSGSIYKIKVKKKHVNSEHDGYLFKCDMVDMRILTMLFYEMFVVEKPVLQVT